MTAAGMMNPARPAQANPRNASYSITQVTVTAMVTAPEPATAVPAPAAAPRRGARYVVQPGDTLSGIAKAAAVHGGWPALYAANRRAIGPDPDVIHPGTVLVLPGPPAHPARYRVRAGDALAGIAAALYVHGGWPALYAANRRAIGPDPDVIHPGAVLTAPRPAPAPATPPPGPPHRRHPPPRPAQPSTSPAPRAQVVTTPAAGMPRWLAAMLLAAGLLIGAAFIAEPAMAIGRRRRRRPRAGPRQDAQRLAAAKARIVLADNDKLIVTYSRADDTCTGWEPGGIGVHPPDKLVMR